MTALVDRLRNKRMRVHDLGGVGFETDPDCNEAADEIEKLTHLHKEAEAEVKVLMAENERLRALAAAFERD